MEISALFVGIAMASEGKAVNEIGKQAFLLSDLVPGLARILHLYAREGNEQQFSDEIASALREYATLKETLSKTTTPALGRQLLDVLDLPFWRFRWYVYEVWATVRLVMAFKDFNAKLLVRNGMIEFRRGTESTIGVMDADAGTQLEIVAQRETPITGFSGRRGIQPDLRVCRPPGTKAEDTLIAVEYKQRHHMSYKEIADLMKLYDAGTPKAKRVILLNYDRIPSSANSLSTSKLILIDLVRPSSPDRIMEYSDSLVQGLSELGLNPTRFFDAILVDLSESMRSHYTPPSTIQELKITLNRFQLNSIWMFSDNLHPQSTSDVNKFCDGILEHVGGGTNIADAFKELNRLVPLLSKLLLITDSGFQPTPDWGRVEVLITLPEEISKNVRNKRSDQQ
jgi:hypothetical protein